MFSGFQELGAKCGGISGPGTTGYRTFSTYRSSDFKLTLQRSFKQNRYIKLLLNLAPSCEIRFDMKLCLNHRNAPLPHGNMCYFKQNEYLSMFEIWRLQKTFNDFFLHTNRKGFIIRKIL